MNKPRKQDAFDNSFYILAGEVTKALERNKDGTLQKDQVEELLDAERKFKETVLKYRQSTEIYKKFLQKIRIQNKNILSARPYFRETAVSFSKRVTPAIKAADSDIPAVSKAAIETLQTFDINYQFISFIRNSWLGPFPKRAEQLYHRVHAARTILIENNMPLAINRAKLFYRKTPKNHLTLMDFIGICAMGLAAGVDKWCGTYSPVFRSVCIGRMVGNMIDSYSETMLHFYPSDKRILYKAHTLRSRKGIDDIKELTEAVKNAFKEDAKEGKSIPKTKVNVSELHALMHGASTVSETFGIPGSAGLNSSPGDGDRHSIYQFTPDINQDTEGAYIQKEAAEKMIELARDLPVLHKKVLRLKGVKI